MRTLHHDEGYRARGHLLDLDEIARQEGARRMLAEALEAEEVQDYLDAARG